MTQSTGNPTSSTLLDLDLSTIGSRELSREDMEALYNTMVKPLKEGEVVTGRIVQVLDNDVVVDVGYKSEGLIPKAEFMDPSGQIVAEVGSEVEVFVERAEDPQGYVILSKEKAQRMKAWEAIERAFRDNATIKGRVLDRIKGGLSVDIGVRAFLPGSLVDVKPIRNLEALRGQEFEFRVIKVNRRRGNIVLSRKAILEEQYREAKERTLTALEPGNLLKGMVKNITEYGAFVDLGGVDGLLHITDMSWGRLGHPSEMFNVGDEVEVLVLSVDREKERVQLGYKQKFPDPWLTVGGKYAVSRSIRGKIVSLTDYGAFVELEPGLEGLIHITEMSWTKKVKHPSAIFKIGDEVEALILDINEETRRISLGIKQMEASPWQKLVETHQVGQKVAGKVRNITDFGAFIEIMDGVDGLVHVSDISWKRIAHPGEVLKKGDDVEAVITHIDAEGQKLSLSIKELTPDVWEQFFNHHVVGSVVEGTVARVVDFGAFVDLGEGVEGLVHVSEMSTERVEHPQDVLAVGQKITMKVVKLDPADRKIGLSIKALAEGEQAGDMPAIRETPNLTMGDLVGEQLKAVRKPRVKKSKPAHEDESRED